MLAKSTLKKQTIRSLLGSEINKTRKVLNDQRKWRSRAQTKMKGGESSGEVKW